MAEEFKFSQRVVSSDAFKYHFKFWHLMGVYPVEYCPLLYVLVLILCVSLPISLAIFLFHVDGIKNILNNLSVNVTLIVCILKFINIFIRRKEILEFNVWINQLDARAESIQERNYLASAIHQAHRIFYIFCILFSAILAFGELSALLAEGRRLMYPAWYPFDWQNSTLLYIVTHVHQFVVIFINICQNIANDTFPTFHMLILTSHVKTLNTRIRKVGANSTKSANRSVQDLIQCIKDRQMLVLYLRTVQKLTSAGIFIQFFTTGIEACISAVCVFFVEGNFFELTYLGVYFAGVIAEIFFYCYYGNELIYESQSMTNAIYSCDWTNRDEKFKKILLIFMQSTQTTMSIKAGGYFTVSLSTFVTVMKSSYSLFALLIRVT
ncbi:odorant receptor 2a-like [Hermetia illucens]|nr:odorant receptor 2a-like [Hermetia illucens]